MLPIKVCDVPRSEAKASNMLVNHPCSLRTRGLNRLGLETDTAETAGIFGGTNRLCRIHGDLIAPYIMPEDLKGKLKRLRLC